MYMCWVCLCHLRLIRLWQRVYDDLSWMLHLQLSDCLLRCLSGHLLCDTCRLQTILLQSGRQRRAQILKKNSRQLGNIFKCGVWIKTKSLKTKALLMSIKCYKVYDTLEQRPSVVEVAHSGRSVWADKTVDRHILPYCICGTKSPKQK